MKTFKEFLLEMDILILSEANIVGIYPNHPNSKYHGSTISYDSTSNKKSKFISSEPNQTIGNEPNKQSKKYYQQNTSYMYNMLGSEHLPPILKTKHPDGSNRNVVIDGNHRLNTYKQHNLDVPAIDIGHKNIHLMPHFLENDIHLLDNTTDKKHRQHIKQYGIPLSKFKEKDGSYNMQKPRTELNNLSLSHYFNS